MIRRLKGIDEDTVEIVQAVYLYLMDWTGVTVGALLFVVSTIALSMQTKELGPWDFMYLTMMCLVCFFLHATQKDKTMFNARAEELRRSILRRVVVIIDTIQVVIYVTEMDYGGAAYHVLWICNWYLMCVMTRDREPPQQWRTATEGAS